MCLYIITKPGVCIYIQYYSIMQVLEIAFMSTLGSLSGTATFILAIKINGAHALNSI